MKRSYNALWWILGLGSQLQIVASLSITEAVVLVMAPFIFMRHWHEMRQDGIMTFWNLSIALLLGCVVSIVVNSTPSAFALRGMAVVVIIPCAIVVSHWLLRRWPEGFKWYLCGSAISGVLCVFVLQKSVEVVMLAGGQAGDGAAEEIMSGPIFWISRVNPFVMLATKGWFLRTPILFDCIVVVALAVFSAMITISGRSAALGALGFLCVLLIGGKCQRTMKRICRHFVLVLVCAIIGIFVIKNVYSYAASTGLMGDSAKTKYETQTKGDKGLWALLMGGRMESFCGLIAAIDKPIVGFGPWAEDTGGYMERFLRDYGTIEDYQNHLNLQQFYLKNGYDLRRGIPCHGQLTQFWVWYGMSGLIFVLYCLFCLIRYLKSDCWAVPQWFAWLACSIPSLLWAMFFSPFSDRIGFPLFIVACLMARAVRKGKFQLPPKMIYEIEKAEKR